MPTPAASNITGTPWDFQGSYAVNIYAVPGQPEYDRLTNLPNAVWLWKQDAGGSIGYDIYNGVVWQNSGVRGDRANENWAKNWLTVRGPIGPRWGTGSGSFPAPFFGDIYRAVVALNKSLMANPASTPLAPLPAGSPAWATTLWQGLQSLETDVQGVGQSSTAAANSAQTAAANSAQAAAAAPSNSAGVSSTTLLALAGAGVLAFLLFKK